MQRDELLPAEANGARAAALRSGLASDDAAIAYWLKERAGSSEHTMRRFARCARLFRVWMKFENLDSMHALNANVAARITAWLASPPPELVAPKGAPRADRAYLFRAGMTAAQLRDTLTILHGMCETLVAAQYLDRNPFAVTAKGKFTRRQKTEPRALNAPAWHLYLEASRRMDPRMRWFAAVMYHLLLRRSEAARLTWDAFSPDPQDASGRGWRVFIYGKGKSEEYLPLSRVAAEEMTRWRLHIGASPFPASGDSSSIWADGRAFTTAGPNPDSLNRWAKLVAAGAIARLDPGQVDARSLTTQLTSLTSHGLRHSRATHLLQNGSTLADAQAALRHANMSTTGRYVRSDRSRLRDQLDRR